MMQTCSCLRRSRSRASLLFSEPTSPSRPTTKASSKCDDNPSFADLTCQSNFANLVLSEIRFKPLNEQERVSDVLVKNELFETDKFDRDFLVKGDLHRIS